MIYIISLILLLLPTYLVKFTVFQIPTTLLEILIYIAFIIQIILFLFYKVTPKKIPFVWIVPISFFILSAVISVFISDNKVLSLGVLKGWIVDPIIVLFLIYNNINSENKLQILIKSIVFSGFVLSVIGLAQLMLGQTLTSDDRVSSLFESANYLAMYLGPLVPLNIYLILKSNKLALKIIWIFILLVSLCALLLTYSYAAWLALVISVIYILVYLVKSKYKYLILAILFVAFGVFAYSQKDTAKFQQIFDFQGRSTLKARTEIWQVSWHLIKKNPIGGIGLGNFEKNYQDNLGKVVWPPLDWTAPEPHNIFLAFWLNMGILGIISFLWIVIMFFQNTFNALKIKKENLLSFFVIVSMLIILIHGLLDTPYWKNDLSIIFWFIVAMGMYLSSLSVSERLSHEKNI